MDEIVRRATDGDGGELTRLQAIARAGIVGVRGGDLRLQECPVVEDWAALLADPSTVVLVGCIDDVVVAYLVMRLSTDRDRGIVTHVYVEVEARELGLGDTMIEHAVAAVIDAGLGGIESTALPGDRETKNLFERAGITARKLTVYRSLRPSAEPAAPPDDTE